MDVDNILAIMPDTTSLEPGNEGNLRFPLRPLPLIKIIYFKFIMVIASNHNKNF